MYFETCTLNDLATLMKVAKSTFVDAFEKHNNPTDFKNYITKAFSKTQMASELLNRNSSFHFICNDDQIVGYYKLNQKEAQKEKYDLNALELERIYIKKEFQSGQFGTRTLLHIIRYAKQNQHSYLWLGVWEQNLRAIAFYKKLGFTKFGQHPYLIGQDEQYDWLMKLDLV